MRWAVCPLQVGDYLGVVVKRRLDDVPTLAAFGVVAVVDGHKPADAVVERIYASHDRDRGSGGRVLAFGGGLGLAAPESPDVRVRGLGSAHPSVSVAC
jgi:hypothetical protein